MWYDKFLSGRFVFTLITAIVFLILSINGTMPVDEVVQVISLILVFYFNRGDRTPPNTNGGTAK